MSTKVREYKIKMPYSISQWRKGQRYVLAKYTTEEVKIINHKKTDEDGKSITESHKFLDLSKRIPSVIRKIMSGNAFFVDEYSTNIDIFNCGGCKGCNKDVMENVEKLKMEEGLLKEANIKCTKGIKEEKSKLEDPVMELESENFSRGSLYECNIQTREQNNNRSETEETSSPKNIKCASKNNFNESSCETKYVNRHYDTNTFNMSVKTYVRKNDEENIFKLPEGYKSKTFDLTSKSSSKDQVIIFKLLEVSINSTFFGWIADNIKNMIRDMLIKFQEKIISTESEWINISEEELIRLETEMIEKFAMK